MGGRQGSGDLDRCIERLAERQAFVADGAGEGGALEILHDDDVAGIVGEDVVDSDDVGMVEGGGGLGFAEEWTEATDAGGGV
jgi:hypothetical protein